MKKYLTISICVVTLFIVSCGNKISPNKLKGNTYSVKHWEYADGTNYATWKNVQNVPIVEVTNVSGTWAFDKNGGSTVNITYDQVHPLSGVISPQTWTDSGTLDMNGKQDFFGVQWDGFGYQQYFIDSKSGSELVIVWEVINAGEYGMVNFLTIKK